MRIKESIIQLLEENRDQWLSGQIIATSLSVSRAAVWKAIKALKQEGYLISASPHLGYRLNITNDTLSSQGILHHLTEPVPIHVYKSIDSTNTELKRLTLNKATHGTLVVADMQTAGRGRFNRSFYSPDKTGIYMSVLLRPTQSLNDATILTMYSAVAVRRAILNLCGKETKIKWVNDIYYQDKKVCGILTEAMSDFESGMLESIIIGIGINLNTIFKDQLKSIATSLNTQEITRNQWIAEVINQLFRIINEPTNLILAEYKQASYILNKPITFTKQGIDYTGLAKDINHLGHLLVEVDGKEMILQAGEISIKKEIADE